MIYGKIVKLLSEQFGMEADEITEETTFEDLGADSVDLVELSMSLEEEFDIDEMGEEDIASIHNVGDLVNYLQGKLGE
ncbi:MAG: acyl carrier protein [Oscillospiraceae bacterium]|nr:acyl carrier protein [Oscillospiraceae bacterium]